MSIIGLVDCKNFFVSCERVFDPSITNKPVIVLSNNDGCIISRSEEAKALGLYMDPYFKVRNFCKAHKVKVLSTNFALYGDMSSRVMSILEEHCPEIEIYSIDEAFIDLSHIPTNMIKSYIEKLRKIIIQYTGIPVRIGVGHTKTLAKLAQLQSKKNNENTYVMLDEYSRENSLKNTKAEEVWGIGPKLSKILYDLDIKNALEIALSSSSVIRKYTKLQGQKIQAELNGIQCFEIEQVHEVKKNISSTRSFARAISELSDLEHLVAQFASISAKKMRMQNSICNSVYVYIRTNKFETKEKYFSSNIEILDESTADTAKLISAAKAGLKKIFKQGYKYKKAGVVLLNLHSKNYKQLNINPNNKENDGLMTVMDHINNKLGRNTIYFLSEGSNLQGVENIGKRQYTSKRYTTHWEELLLVK